LFAGHFKGPHLPGLRLGRFGASLLLGFDLPRYRGIHAKLFRLPEEVLKRCPLRGLAVALGQLGRGGRTTPHLKFLVVKHL
jgi:hypothetical protein